MTKYVVVSPRVGTVGDEYDADTALANGINLEALIAGGFISTAKPVKSGKKEVDENDQE